MNKAQVFQISWVCAMLFLFYKIGYTNGHNDGYFEHGDFMEKLEWISDCQYKGEKTRNKAECEILYLEKSKGDL